jgi:hypothetical protein
MFMVATLSGRSDGGMDETAKARDIKIAWCPSE